MLLYWGRARFARLDESNIVRRKHNIRHRLFPVSDIPRLSVAGDPQVTHFSSHERLLTEPRTFTTEGRCERRGVLILNTYEHNDHYPGLGHDLPCSYWSRYE